MTLTQKQIDVYEVIQTYIQEHHYPPTIRDICILTGLKSSSTAHGYLERLKKHGLITWEPEKTRSLKLISRGG